MKQCKDHCQRVTTAIDQMRKDVEAAEQSNAPRENAHYEEAEKGLTEMSQHMNS